MKSNNNAVPLAMLCVLFFCSLSHAAEIIGKVVGVKDGDTITVLDDLDRVTFQIRLFDIDAPENDQPFCEKSKQALSGLCFGKQVTIRFTKVDRLKRLIGTVHVEGKDIQLEMLKMGMAWHYKEFSKNEEYAKAEEEARKKKIGLWADPNPVPPWNWRKTWKKKQESVLQKKENNMGMYWYYQGNKRIGPVSIETLRDMASRGVITEKTILENESNEKAYAVSVLNASRQKTTSVPPQTRFESSSPCEVRQTNERQDQSPTVTNDTRIAYNVAPQKLVIETIRKEYPTICSLKDARIVFVILLAITCCGSFIWYLNRILGLSDAGLISSSDVPTYIIAYLISDVVFFVISYVVYDLIATVSWAIARMEIQSRKD